MKVRTTATFVLVLGFFAAAGWLLARNDRGSNRYVMQVAACFPSDVAVVNAFERPDRIYRAFAALEDGLLVELAEEMAEEGSLLEVAFQATEDVRGAGVDPRAPSGWALRFDDEGNAIAMGCMGAAGLDPLARLQAAIEEQVEGLELEPTELDGHDVLRLGDTWVTEHDGQLLFVMSVDNVDEDTALETLDSLIDLPRRDSFAATPGLRKAVRFGEPTLSAVVATASGLAESPIWTGNTDLIEDELEVGAIGFSVSDRGISAHSRAVFADGSGIPAIYERSRPMRALNRLPDLDGLAVIYHVHLNDERLLRFVTGIVEEEELDAYEELTEAFEEAFGLSLEDDVLPEFTGEYGAVASFSPGADGAVIAFIGVRDEDRVAEFLDALVAYEPVEPGGDSMADLDNLFALDMLMPGISREELGGHDAWRVDGGGLDPTYLLVIADDYLWWGDEALIEVVLSGDGDLLRARDEYDAAFDWLRERSAGAVYVDLGTVAANILRIFSSNEEELERLDEGIGGLFLSGRRRGDVLEGELFIEWDLARLLEGVDEMASSGLFEPQLPPMPAVVEVEPVSTYEMDVARMNMDSFSRRVLNRSASAQARGRAGLPEPFRAFPSVWSFELACSDLTAYRQELDRLEASTPPLVPELTVDGELPYMSYEIVDEGASVLLRAAAVVDCEADLLVLEQRLIEGASGLELSGELTEYRQPMP